MQQKNILWIVLALVIGFLLGWLIHTSAPASQQGASAVSSGAAQQAGTLAVQPTVATSSCPANPEATITLDPNTDLSRTISSGSTNVNLAIVDVSAGPCDVIIKSLAFQQYSSKIIGNVVSNLTLYESNGGPFGQVGSTLPLTSINGFTGLKVIIPAGTTAKFAVKADVNGAGGTQFGLKLSAITGTDIQTGITSPSIVFSGLPQGNMMTIGVLSPVPILTVTPILTNATQLVSTSCSNPSLATFSIKFSITAGVKGIYIPQTIGSSTSGNQNTANAERATTPVTNGTAYSLAQIGSIATNGSNSNWHIPAGQTATFLATITVPDNMANGGDGQYRGYLQQIKWDIVDTATPANVFMQNLGTATTSSLFTANYISLTGACGITASLNKATAVVTSKSGDNNDIGTFVINYKVTAIGENAYMSPDAGPYFYTVDKSGVQVTLGYISTMNCLTGCSKTLNGNYLVSTGTSSTFSLTVVVDSSLSGGAGNYRLTLNDLLWNTDDSTGYNAYILNPTYQTLYIYLN